MSEAKTDLTSDVTSVLQRQADAWNAGDLKSFMNAYAPEPTTAYISAGEEIYGYDALLHRYESHYGNSPETMGHLAFSELRITPLGRDHAMCVGHWQVQPAKSDKQLSGIFSLVLARTAGGWKIIHDHTSKNDPAPKADK